MKLANGHPIKIRRVNHYASEPLHSPRKCRDRLHRYELGHKCPSPKTMMIMIIFERGSTYILWYGPFH